MLTYQIRRRVFRLENGATTFEFPAMVEITMSFKPLQPFGMEAGGGRTIMKARAAQVLFNANSGEHLVTSEDPLKPLEVTVELRDQTITFQGNLMTYRQNCNSIAELDDLINSLYISVPLMLAVEFGDPPYIEYVRGRVGTVSFRWELASWISPLDVTTQEHQQKRVVNALDNIPLVAGEKPRRLLAALQYFHVACRLNRLNATPGEFLPEALLNFHKILEVLFGPNRDDVRKELRTLGYSDTEIEADFIPVMLLRNSIDVGHPMLSLFKLEQLETLHAYADSAEQVFKVFFRRYLGAIKKGEVQPKECKVEPIDSDTRRTIAAIGRNLEAKRAKTASPGEPAPE